MENALILIRYIVQHTINFFFNVDFLGGVTLGGVALSAITFSILFNGILHVFATTLPKVNSHRDTGSKELAAIERRD